MSRPRPIHKPHRELRSQPDESEPSLSYEDRSFMTPPSKAEVEEDAFHHRSLQTRHFRHSGSGSASGSLRQQLNQHQQQQEQQQQQQHQQRDSSFWRTNQSSSHEQPSFSSMSLQPDILHLSSSGLSKASPSPSAAFNHSRALRQQAHHQQRHFNSSAPKATTFEKQDSGEFSKRSAEKKFMTKQRSNARRTKLEAQNSDLDLGHLETGPLLIPPTEGNLSRSSSEQSGSLLLYATRSGGGTGKGNGSTLSSGNHSNGSGSQSVLLGKTASLIFPTGVEASKKDKSKSKSQGSASGGSNGSSSGSSGGSGHLNQYHASSSSASSGPNTKEARINLLLDQCEAIRFPFKKKLILEKLNMSRPDIPLKDLIGTSLGQSLHKLSLTGNPLTSLPNALVQNLPTLKHLDVSQCGLVCLPDVWVLPQLRRLNLSHNRLSQFPEDPMLEGLPELLELNLFSNKIAEIAVPTNLKLLSKLETLNMGFNDLQFLPDELDQLRALRILKVTSNFIDKVPMRICDMDLKSIDVSSNPVTCPPLETCERGICSMKRYYHCIKKEEQAKNKTLELFQKKLRRRQGGGGKRLFHKNSSSSSALPTHPASTLLSTSSSAPQANVKSIPLSPILPLKPASSSSSASMVTSKIPSIQPPTLPSRPDSMTLPQRGVSREEPIMLPSKIERKPFTRQRSYSFDGLTQKAQEELAKVLEPEVKSAELTETASRKESLTSTSSVENDAVKNVTINDTLKVIFVGMAMTGKTSMIKRLIEGKDAVIPQRDDRTIGVDIYEWDPLNNTDRPRVETRLENNGAAVNVKFSVWDFAGQHVYHATHELFFSQRALYVVVWDMGATNTSTHRRKSAVTEQGTFKLTYDSSDEEDNDDFAAEEETNRADRELERDIDEKVQFWIECIQSCAPGSAILPVASFDDYFPDKDGEEEAKRRCGILKKRLLKHEERRIEGIKQRLKEYEKEGRADSEGASRLRKLLCPYTRPKLAFGDDENPTVRVSGTGYTGFDKLTEKVVRLATGKDSASRPYPLFHGHVGARIPRMRLEVRDAVREMRDRFKVVEWGYFVKTLREERGLTSVEDISDALHFLTNVGELSYFGNVLPDRLKMQEYTEAKRYEMKALSSDFSSFQSEGDGDSSGFTLPMELDEDELGESAALLAMEGTTAATVSVTEDGSLSTLDDVNITGLSQYVFLNPRWLVAAVACILRHDLEREIREARRALSGIKRSGSFHEGNLNCPVITSEDALVLWQAKKFTNKAAERAKEYSNNMRVTPFDFLQQLLVRFGVFVPIDLSIEKALLGGKEYSQIVDNASPLYPPTDVIQVNKGDSSEDEKETPNFFFLPSLLGPGEPAEAWTYKNTDSWRITICHSILFPDGVPPGLMERITAAVLSSIYAVSKGIELLVVHGANGKTMKTLDGPLHVKEILCWRTAFFLKLGTETKGENGEVRESVTEIFAHLTDRDSPLCVGSDHMSTGMRRFVLSAKGQVGDGGKKIWNGGYLLVMKSVAKVMTEYEGLEFEKQGFCPECLSKKSVSEASCWDFPVIRDAALRGEAVIRCSHGHRIDTRFLTGPIESLTATRIESVPSAKFNEDPDTNPVVPVSDILRSVVLIGLWDGKSQKVVRAGSGFIVDKKRGLIVTASHTLMNIWGDKSTPFGENYYGLREGKVVIGVILQTKDSNGKNFSTEAKFRYFAKIVAKDPNMDEVGECNIDACVLKITTRLEKDIGGNGDGCGDQPETLLSYPDAMKKQRLHHLKVTEKYELDEHVRVLGFNQGGEGLLGPGESLNRYADFARGYVCTKFATDAGNGGNLRHRFKPREEIVVMCPTIGGHSGGPCVNQQGEVIGILSRADSQERQRCYLVPANEWKPLVKRAKNLY